MIINTGKKAWDTKTHYVGLPDGWEAVYRRVDNNTFLCIPVVAINIQEQFEDEMSSGIFRDGTAFIGVPPIGEYCCYTVGEGYGQDSFVCQDVAGPQKYDFIGYKSPKYKTLAEFLQFRDQAQAFYGDSAL